MMTALVEIVRNYVNPPEVKELFKEYAQFHETLIPSYTFPMPGRIQKLMERAYELGGIPQKRITRAVEDLPLLEQKIDELKTKYSWQTTLGLGVAATSVLYVIGAVVLGSWNPDLQSKLMSETSLYTACGVGLLALVHGIRSASALVNVHDVGYCVDKVLKSALSSSRTEDN